MRLGHPVVAVVGGVALVAAIALERPVLADPPQASGVLELYDAVPPESPVRIPAGEKQRFSVWVRGEGLRYQWMLDGGPVGDRRSWTFAPQETDIGPHLVTVAVDGPDGRGTWTWRVQVGLPAGEQPVTTTTSEPAVPPSTVTAPTEPPTSTTAAPTTSTSSTQARPTSSTTTSTQPRPTTTTSTRAPTTTRVPTTTSTSTTREPTTSTRRPTTTSTERPTTTTAAAPPTTTTLMPAPPPGARGRGIGEAEIRALFERYKAAWRNHDIRELEAVGQVATQGQADALASYFESVRDLDVDVTILSITAAGDEARVRFIRRDRFRDPGGNMVTKESPVVEKRIVRTPGGLRLAPVR